MKIEVMDEVKIDGKNTGLWNYRYVSNDGKPISATFQATERQLSANINVPLMHFVDSL